MNRKYLKLAYFFITILVAVALFIHYNQQQSSSQVNLGGKVMTSKQSNSTIKHHVTINFNNQSFAATLNDSPATQSILKKLPLTVQFRTYGNDKEKIAGLPFTPELGNYDYDDNGQAGKIAYWQPDNRLVIYYGSVGHYPGINVIGSFDDPKAAALLQKAPDDTKVTFSN